MNIQEIKKLKTEELVKELLKKQEELFEVSKDIRNGKEKNVKKSLRIKRIIARIQTVLNEKEKVNLKDSKNDGEKGDK
jgi:ribosomal protein L29